MILFDMEENKFGMKIRVKLEWWVNKKVKIKNTQRVDWRGKKEGNYREIRSKIDELAMTKAII